MGSKDTSGKLGLGGSKKLDKSAGRPPTKTGEELKASSMLNSNLFEQEAVAGVANAGRKGSVGEGSILSMGRSVGRDVEA
jgi:hypothetical protein